MSRTTLIFFRGKEQIDVEFHNAWGGAARIWDSLFERYCEKRHQYDSWILTPNDRRLWDLAQRQDLPAFERAVHAFTFDRLYVRREHFLRLAIDLRSFSEKYPARGLDHLPAWADSIEKSQDEAVGVHCTSVSENVWRPFDEEKDEAIPVFPGDENTYEVYDWLESQTHAAVTA